ncbi:unnamed protein product [Oppiella nova]|uniref:Uncharacterized protein n=1 Tax=Oppiella nova TaxID=334625 RepID=A0A7R9LQ23_9ACAR|nr:unnamed protein product [Oppiella nova]CAG2165833.1 unnamed protein product [Oppiella nova]
MNDTYSHRIVSNDITNDCDEDSCDEDTNDNDFDDQNTDESKTIVDLIEFKYLVNLYNERFDGRVGSIVRSITKDFRLVLSLTLLIIAMVIMVWSLLPIGFPCECRCSYSWYQILSAILMSHSSQDIVSPIQ